MTKLMKEERANLPHFRGTGNLFAQQKHTEQMAEISPGKNKNKNKNTTFL